MTKIIKVLKDIHGEREMLMADLSIYSKNEKEIRYIDVFHLFVPVYLVSISKKGDVFQNPSAYQNGIINLNTKIINIKYCIDIFIKESKHFNYFNFKSRRNYSYIKVQNLIGYLDTIFEMIHSLNDLLGQVDKDLKGISSKNNMYQEEWFRLCVDIRNCFHHIVLPFFDFTKSKGNNIYFSILGDALNKLENRKYFIEKINDIDRVELRIDLLSLYNDLMIYLDKWAFHYLNNMNKNLKVGRIMYIYRDGTYKHKAVSLEEMLKKVTVPIKNK